MAVAILLALALVAGACGDDSGESAPGEGVGSGIDGIVRIQTVQDFAIHLRLSTLVEDELRDHSAELRAELSERSGRRTALAGGLTLVHVDDIAARMVESDGVALPSLSVDLAVLEMASPGDDVLTEEIATAATAAGILAFPNEEPARDPVAGRLLVEIATAADGVSTNVGFGDRSEIDVTFVDGIRPGDPAALEYLFGQTLPGDPEVEAGLGPIDLFASRWNAGLVRFLGDGPIPVPVVDTSIRVVEGSTILSRETKGGLALVAGVLAAGDNRERIIAELLRRARARPETSVSAPAPGPLGEAGAKVVMERRVTPSGTVRFHIGLLIPNANEVGGVFRDVRGDDAVGAASALADTVTLVQTINFWLGCTLAATAMRANNEALSARSVIAGPNSIPSDFPTSRFLADGPDGGPTTVAPDGDGGAEGVPEEEPPPVGCAPTDDDAPGFGGAAFGDVRIATLDGVVYGQQAPGEFLLFENDTMTIQMRAEPAGESDNLTVATAFALRTGGDTLAMHRGGRTFVNGEERDLARGARARVGDAEVLWDGLNGWTIVWPDDQIVKAFDRGSVDGMSLTVEPLRGSAVGQFGDGDGDPENDFVTRDGRGLDPDIVDDHDSFYDTYVESWRIGQDESLFHYEDGETTDSFRINDFPRRGVDQSDFGPAAWEEAVLACESASITDEVLFEGCLVDVAATGDPGYAFDTFRVQLVTTPRRDAPTQESGDDPPPPRGDPGDTVLTVDGETLVFGEDPPNQRELGIAPSWRCQVTDGNLFADGSIDLADGPRYSLDVQYLAAEPRLILILTRSNDDGLTRNFAVINTANPDFADAVDSMALDGDRFTARGALLVDESLEQRIAPGHAIPPDARLAAFTLDLDCAS